MGDIKGALLGRYQGKKKNPELGRYIAAAKNVLRRGGSCLFGRSRLRRFNFIRQHEREKDNVVIFSMYAVIMGPHKKSSLSPQQLNQHGWG